MFVAADASRRTWRTRQGSVGGYAAVLLLLIVTSSASSPCLAFPSGNTALGSVLEGFTQRYRESIVFVRATRAVGPNPQSLSVVGAPSLTPETETLWSAGVVCDGSGRVVTCADGAQPTDGIVLVTLDGTELPARFVAQDGRTGLSLIEPADVSPTKPLAPLGRCASAAPMRENDWVVLLGPDPSVSTLETRLGRLERILPATSTGGTTLLRIDVEGSPGGCGAVVVDGNGDLVGMVVDRDPLVENPGATVQGILDEPVWALPRGTLFDAATSLLNSDHTRTGFLGVQTTQRSLAEADVERVPISAAPIEVRRVLPGSPAEQAGLMEGDLLLSVDGELVQDVTAVSERVSEIAPGSTATLQVLRGGIQYSLQAVIGDRSSLDWLDRCYRRNLRRERLLESEIDLLEQELGELRALQERLQ